jgi:hypothetical protein
VTTGKIPAWRLEFPPINANFREADPFFVRIAVIDLQTGCRLQRPCAFSYNLRAKQRNPVLASERLARHYSSIVPGLLGMLAPEHDPYAARTAKKMAFLSDTIRQLASCTVL